MKNISLLTAGQSVIFSANLVEFIIKELKPEKETVIICINEAPETEREARISHIYPATEHVKEASKIAKEKRDSIKAIIPFGITINEKIMNKSFMEYWINMCEVEGDTKALEAVKADLDLFIDAIKNRINVIQNLNINGIRFIAPMLPDEE